MSDPVKRLRIYTDESAYFGDHKVFEVVTARAQAAGVAGAAVTLEAVEVLRWPAGGAAAPGRDQT